MIKMVTMNGLLFALIITLAGNLAAKAYTVEENFDYINKVIGQLNVYWECQLPTYAEVDELQKSFQELEESFGFLFEAKLSDDQRLVLKTLLDQWASFQARMTDAVVIRSAKKRSFLGKVEAYQKGKFGFSVCIQLKDVRGPVTDRIFEKNPIVRYVKHLETGDVPDQPAAEPEKTDLEKETEVIHTPINEVVEDAKSPKGEKESTSMEETTTSETTTIVDENAESEEAKKRKEEEDNYDPLADIPVPSAQEEPEEASTIITTTPSPPPPPPTTTEFLEVETSTEFSVPDTTTELEAEAVEEIVTTEAAPIEPTTTPVSVVTLYEFGGEYVDDEADDEDLNRLDKVVPAEWNIDPIYGNFRWPDENPGENDTSIIDGNIKIEWNKFLDDPDFVEIVEEQQTEVEKPVTEVPVTEEPEYMPRRLSPKELRRKRKELLDKISGDRRSREQDQLHGYSHSPEREHQETKKDRWSTIADNNVCKISYNRDKVVTRPVKAVKSLFTSSGSSKKKAMMSRA